MDKWDGDMAGVAERGVEVVQLAPLSRGERGAKVLARLLESLKVNACGRGHFAEKMPMEILQ